MQVPYKRLMFLPLFVCMIGEASTSKPQGEMNIPSPLIFHPPQSKASPVRLKEEAVEIEAPNAYDDKESSFAASEQPNQSEQIKAVILEQLDAIRNQDLSKAYYAYSAVDFQQTVPLDTFKIFMKQNLAFFRSRTFEIQNITFTGILVSVKGVLIDSNQRQTLVEYNFIQENGNWKIRKIILSAPTETSGVPPPAKP